MKPNCDEFFNRIIAAFPEYKLTQAECGGDWDATPVRVESPDFEEDSLEISPYVDPNGETFVAGKGQKIYAVEVRSASSDSRGGCNSKNEQLCIAYGRITCWLRNLGLRVANHYSEFF